jgi:hypothetical protein
MGTRAVVGIVGILVLAGGLASGAASGRASLLVAGGTETMIGTWEPGQGTIGPGDAASDWLDRAYEERDALMACIHVYTDLFVPALARDPRFHAVLERMRLTDVALSDLRRVGGFTVRARQPSGPSPPEGRVASDQSGESDRVPAPAGHGSRGRGTNRCGGNAPDHDPV